jgi:predicted O-methyltransferase YrrM
MKYQFSSDWVTSHEADWLAWFGHLIGRQNVSILEIGCWEGRSSCWWLDNILTDPSSRLTCIDPFSWIDNSQKFWGNIYASGKQQQVEFIRNRSEHVLPTMLSEKRQFDLVYVDGSHFAKDVLIDGSYACRLVKRDGFILFDDYRYKNQNDEPSPQIAIDAIVAANRLTVVAQDWQLLAKSKKIC